MKKIIFFLLISNFALAQWSISNAERGALINIYNSTDGENWNRTWDLEKDPRNWFGVSVKNGTVVELNLAGNALKGYFPTYVSSLSKLNKLDLSNNQLSGEIPMGISSLTGLKKLDVSNNLLIGDPTNSMTGFFELEDLGLGGNKFEIANVNTLLQNFNNIKILNIADLGLTSIPQKISSFSTLNTLILDNNTIAASSFGTISRLISISNLSLSGNSLSQVPSQLSSLSLLKTLNLSNNNFTEQNIGGLSGLVNLEWLSLENNQLTQVPAQLAQLKNLRTLNLGRNQITGGISTITALTNLEQLFLNNNLLTGSFPSELSGMKKLLMLNLNSNQLSGNISGLLPEITFLSNNRFTKSQLSNYITDNTEQTDLNYSPQRYDQETTVLAIVGEQAKLEQSLSGDYAFTWYKNLDQKLNKTTEALNFDSVQESDFAYYTAEAYSYQTLENEIFFELSLFREPVLLGDALATLGVSDLSNLYIYPNPTTDYINIVSPKIKVEKVSIYDLSGKQMLSDSKNKINVSKLPSGVYMINIKTPEGIKNFKFIKK